LTLKQEFEALSLELLETRSLVKTHCQDQMADKMRFFEDFKHKVLVQLEVWEVQAADLSVLS